ncbi:L-2-hydroxyglutarate oxidase [Pseudotabrizicola alkalilacus]|uniref:L-2-hydroxyglutarate oxidase n=1 Tax=Pseudotabrizicola alkalilacus TaxID=2305252 RepID=A0A411Z826_9RHOB|nr:L-2-hydroxyglutarate oxidase [Pseudotabrizicola alkalilacus]RGP39152.1 L-2-hydroxyglutarate oxidase [Pseudotabrizicola alkalilacus]
MRTADLVIVGGGIVGLATALALQQRQPAARILLLEKEPSVALHQTGRNSGVIHAGVYYPPGSLKAQFCRQGAQATRAFCDAHGLAYEDCGKLIVATDESELPRMEALFQRASANGIPIERVTQAQARDWEPNIAAIGALWSPTTGIVDYAAVARKMADLFTARGGTLETGTDVVSGQETAQGITLTTPTGPIQAAKAVFCAGLHADRMAATMGLEPDFRIIPFRGEYFRILNQPADLVRRLIYPVPDPERPFLGVHLTRKMGGGFTVGPNAVLALKREGYARSDLSPRDLAAAFAWPGFWRMLARNARPAMGEFAASISTGLYLKKVQRYAPHLTRADLAPYRAGVRAQAVARDGRLIDDFLFLDGRHSLHVCNAPSPAATAALPIASHIADRLLGGT